MTKQEFRNFCHEEFTKRGFRKKKKMYYLKGKDLLCGLYLQKSMAEAYYVEYDFFVGEYGNVKDYPTTYESDISRRFVVVSRDTIRGRHFMTALIEYELYTAEEVREYFEREFKEHIIPVLAGGKKQLIQDIEYFFEEMFVSKRKKLLEKLNVPKEDSLWELTEKKY